MGGKQSTATRSRGPFPGVSTDDSAVPPPGGGGGPPPFGHYRAGGGGGAMGLRSRSVSSVAGMGMDPAAAGAVPFGLYAAAARAAGEAERAPGGGGGGPGSDSTYAHGNSFQETGGGHHRDGMLYLGARASLADALPLHIAPRWFSSHSGECLLPRAFPRLPLPPWVPGGGGGRGSPGKGELPPLLDPQSHPLPSTDGWVRAGAGICVKVKGGKGCAGRWLSRRGLFWL